MQQDLFQNMEEYTQEELAKKNKGEKNYSTITAKETTSYS